MDCCEGLVFSSLGRLDVRHERDVHDDDILRADFQDELPDRLEKGQALDVAGGAADFGDDDVARLLGAELAQARLDLVGDVRDDLHGLAEVIAAPLLIEHGLVDLAAGGVVRAREHGVGEALVMAEVEIGLRAVVEHIDFAVLEGAHRAGIDVQIRVEFLHHDLEAAMLEQRAERGRRQALAQRGNDAAGDENVFH